MKPTKLHCPPFGDLHVECDVDDLENPAPNCQRLKAAWPDVWPSIYEAFWNVVQEYEHEDFATHATKHLAIKVPDFAQSIEAEWSVSIITDPSCGLYEIELQGMSVVDAGATF